MSHYKGLVDASFVWERVTYPGIVVAECSVLTAREDIMLHSHTFSLQRNSGADSSNDLEIS